MVNQLHSYYILHRPPPGLLAVGLLSGEVKLVMMDWQEDTGSVIVMGTFTVWIEQDKIVPKVIEWNPQVCGTL